VNIYIKLLFAIAISFTLPLTNAEPVETQAEWVVVLDDPRPARLKGWQRKNYSASGDYRNALELKRTGQRIAKKHDLLVRAEWFIETLGVYCLIVALNQGQKNTLDRLRKDKKVKSVQRSNSFELLQTKSQQASTPTDIDSSLLDPFLGRRGTRDAPVFGIIDKDSNNMPILIDGSRQFSETGIPTANVTGSPGFCQLEDVSDTDLGFDYLVRFVMRANGNTAVTVRLKDVEQLFCTSDVGGEITYADLTEDSPSFSVVSLTDIRRLNRTVNEIIR